MSSKKIFAITLITLITAGAAIALWTDRPARLSLALRAVAQESEHDHAAAEAEHQRDHDDATADAHDEEHDHETEATREEDSGHEGHDDHADHAGEDEHEDEQVVSFSPEQLSKLGIEVATATSGTLELYAEFPGEVRLNEDELIHVVPRVGGIVREVRATLSDDVRQGDVMAVLESRELADLKAEYLAARERVELREATFEREKKLFEKQLSPEQDYLVARQAVRETQIALKAAEQKLHAVGFSEDYLDSLPSHPDATLTLYSLIAQADGTVIEKHITRGEVLEETSQPFTIANLSTVWVDLKIYQKDIPRIRKGQPVRIAAGEGIEPGEGAISYIGPVVGEQTRTALARVVLPNPDRPWRAGMFITGRVAVDLTPASVVVPKSAIQTLEVQQVVFVRGEEGFEPYPVRIGREDAERVEILEGLRPGQRYAATGAFTLKAELAKGTFDAHGGHAH